MSQPTLPVRKARSLARELREADPRGRRTSAKVADVRYWPIWKVRAAEIWLQLWPGEMPLSDWFDERRGLRHCRVCGCTDDFACDTEEGCYWVEADLCSACAETNP